MTVNVPAPRPANYLPIDFTVSDWDHLAPFYQELKDRLIKSEQDLEQWLLDRSELEAFVGEDLSRRYIALTVNSEDESAVKKYQYAVQHLLPSISEEENALNQKLVDSEWASQLDSETYHTYLRGVRKDLELFRKENIPLATQEQLKAKDYGTLFSKMTIEHEGEQLTLQQAGALLEEQDRSLRENIYLAVQRRIAEDREAIEKLFDDLIDLRQQMAKNAGFENYRDFKFKAMGRFDYQPQDCFDFHDAIEQSIVPVQDQLLALRQERLGLDTLRPWDLSVDWSGEEPLRPYSSTEELIAKTKAVMGAVDSRFGEVLTIMDAVGHLDLDSRKGKSPGGYNMPLHRTGIPFIFMNASGTVADMRTLLHEGGHAVHSIMMRDYPLNENKQPPSEVAELASMTMELITMDEWDQFFANEEECRRAKINQLESVLKTLPWVATIDQFQHWIYTHPGHTQDERKAAWNRIYARFSSQLVDRSGLEDYQSYLWHRQLHIFEVPFYYIEYGMAQLGAVAIWKRFREQPEEAIRDFKQALALGYTRPIGELYEAAGIRFDFSPAYVQELGDFVQEELNALVG
jgi:oligoendopeptidase F